MCVYPGIQCMHGCTYVWDAHVCMYVYPDAHLLKEFIDAIDALDRSRAAADASPTIRAAAGAHSLLR